MTLAAGTKLGRYEIRSKIGEGGMGGVYRAARPPALLFSPVSNAAKIRFA
jgi:hypothetical protein